jgi:hypothetical protein
MTKGNGASHGPGRWRRAGWELCQAQQVTIYQFP